MPSPWIKCWQRAATPNGQPTDPDTSVERTCCLATVRSRPTNGRPAKSAMNARVKQGSPSVSRWPDGVEPYGEYRRMPSTAGQSGSITGPGGLVFTIDPSDNNRLNPSGPGRPAVAARAFRKPGGFRFPDTLPVFTPALPKVLSKGVLMRLVPDGGIGPAANSWWYRSALIRADLTHILVAPPPGGSERARFGTGLRRPRQSTPGVPVPARRSAC